MPEQTEFVTRKEFDETVARILKYVDSVANKTAELETVAIKWEQAKERARAALKRSES